MIFAGLTISGLAIAILIVAEALARLLYGKGDE